MIWCFSSASTTLVEALSSACRMRVVFRGNRALGLDLGTQLALHLIEGAQHLAGLVRCALVSTLLS